MYFPAMIIMTLTLFSLTKLISIIYKTSLLKKDLIASRNFGGKIDFLLNKLNLENASYIVKSDKPFAFCFGILNPKIYISTEILSIMTQNELEAILLHEKYHLKHHDALITIIISLTKSLLPFFPIISDFSRNYQIEQEIQADKNALVALHEKKFILSVMEKLLKYPAVSFDFVSGVGSEETLEPRIKSILLKDFKYKTYKKTNVILSLLLFLAFFLTLISPVSAVEVHNSKQDLMVLCVNGSCENSCNISPKSKIGSVKESVNQNASYNFSHAF